MDYKGHKGHNDPGEDLDYKGHKGHNDPGMSLDCSFDCTDPCTGMGPVALDFGSKAMGWEPGMEGMEGMEEIGAANNIDYNQDY